MEAFLWINNTSSLFFSFIVIFIVYYVFLKKRNKEEEDVFTGVVNSSPFQSIYNFRDIGGLPISKSNKVVKKELFYRSGAPTCSSPPDVETLLSKVNVRTLVDLRSDFEVRRPNHAKKVFEDHFLLQDKIQKTPTGKRIMYNQPLLTREFLQTVSKKAPFLVQLKCRIAGLFSEQIRYLILLRHVGVIGLHQLYIWTIEDLKQDIGNVFRILMYSEGPIMLFCALGKDRTGTVIALLLDLLGVPRDLIIDDYVKSHGQISKKDEEFLRKYFSNSFIGAKAESMVKFLQYVDEHYGSASKYLEAAGFSLSEQAILREKFTVDKNVNNLKEVNHSWNNVKS